MSTLRKSTSLVSKSLHLSRDVTIIVVGRNIRPLPANLINLATSRQDKTKDAHDNAGECTSSLRITLASTDGPVHFVTR